MLNLLVKNISKYNSFSSAGQAPHQKAKVKKNVAAG